MTSSTTLPTTQQAIVVKQTGGPSAMQFLQDWPCPQIADVEPNKILVKNVFAGINFIDTNVRKGAMPAPLPLVPGMEGSGTVIAAGSKVSNTFPIGSKVGYLGIGAKAYAQYPLVDASICVPVASEKVSFEDICGAMMQGMTMHYLVSADGSYEVKEGDTVLIHAGAGGVGLLLTQICKAKGARVLTTVSTQAKADISKKAGADAVVRYSTDDGSSTHKWVEEARAFASSSGGYNVVYDSVGKTTFAHSLDLVAKTGTVVLFGAASGPPDPIAPLSLGPKSIKLTRPMVFHYTATPEALRKRGAEVLDWIAKGYVKFDYQISPLADAAQVHEALEARKTSGKLLLRV